MFFGIVLESMVAHDDGVLIQYGNKKGDESVRILRRRLPS